MYMYKIKKIKSGYVKISNLFLQTKGKHRSLSPGLSEK